MAGPYLPLWQRQRLLASVGAVIVMPAPGPPEPGEASGNLPEANGQAEPADAGTWFLDGLARLDESEPPLGEVE
jgi:hypothetical protein